MKYLTILLFVFSCLFAQEKESTDWLVQIKLRSGASLNGVVKNGVFVEKKGFAGSFQTLTNQNAKIVNDLKKSSSRKVKSSSSTIGLRLWYVRGSNGYTFLPYRDVREIIVIEKGYDALPEVNKKIEEMEEYVKEQQRLEKIEAIEAERREKERKEQEKKKQLEQKKEPEIFLTNKEADLLFKFPPGFEWNAEARERFHKRLNNSRNNFSVKVVNGRRIVQKGPPNGGLSSAEKEFYDNYEEWLVAIDKDKQIQEQKRKKEEEAKKKNTSTKKKEEPKDIVQAENKVEEKTKEEVKTKERPPVKKEVSYLDVEREISVLYNGSNPQEKVVAASKIAEWGKNAKNAIPALTFISLNAQENIDVRLATVRALSYVYTDEEDIIKVFGKALVDSDAQVRKVAIDTLWNLNEDLTPIEKDILFSIVDTNPEIRFRGLLIIAKQGFVNFENSVNKRLILDGSDNNKVAAAYALLTLANNEKNLKTVQSYREYLTSALESGNEEIKSLAQETLNLLSEEDE